MRISLSSPQLLNTHGKLECLRTSAPRGIDLPQRAVANLEALSYRSLAVYPFPPQKGAFSLVRKSRILPHI